MAEHPIQRIQKNRVDLDRRVKWVITMGGWLVLIALVVLIWHLISVSFPLIKSPQLRQIAQISLPEQKRLTAVVNRDNQSVYFFSGPQCELDFFVAASDATQAMPEPLPLQRILPGVDDGNSGQHTCGNHQLVKVHDDLYLFQISHTGILRGRRFVPEKGTFSDGVFSVKVIADGSLRKLADWQVAISDNKVSLLLNYEAEPSHFMRFQRSTRNLLVSRQLSTDSGLTLAAIGGLDILYSDSLFYWIPETASLPSRTFSRTSRAPVIQLSALQSQRSFLLLDQRSQLEKWSVLNQTGQPGLHSLYQLSLPEGAVKGFAHLGGELAIAVVDDVALLLNTTVGEIVSEAPMPKGILRSLLGNNRLYLSYADHMQVWQVDDPESVFTRANLWDAIWYDGYPEPKHVWQTSSASDNIQAKYSLLPLFIGSIKAAMLALLVAIPLAIGSAIYSAYYSGPGIRRIIKPYIEVLEAIPSVVIGFIAAIWLLPISENYLTALILFFVLTPILFIGFLIIYDSKRHLNIAGWEILFFISFIFIYLAFFHWVLMENQAFFSWFTHSEMGGQISSEAKHTFVLALALGLAIVPTVFTIAEDAIFQVPKSLTKASFAMGANRAQTLVRIVLKLALPGIISAIMLGFARAVGETMIVLMISGNTPVADWDLFEGLRTMSATLAIELPEAQPDSIHYQVLFFVALLLFCFTFIFNTLAELLRLQLKKRYRL